MSLNYSEFIPVLNRAEEALTEVLEDNGVYDHDVSYDIENGVIAVSWREGNKGNEILACHAGSRDQVVLEGYSVKDNGVVQGASTHFGETHASVLEPNLRAQYGLLQGLEEQDYEQKNWL